MDIASLFGYIVILLALVIGMFAVNLPIWSLLDFASFCIAIVAPVAATVISHPLSITSSAYRLFLKIFRVHEVDLIELSLRMITFSQKARRDGLLSLEDDIYNVDDYYIKKGIQLIVDGTDPEMVRGIMELEIKQIEERHSLYRSWWEVIGEVAPAYGLIGTLIGLVAMLRNLGGDASLIGQGMSAALLTTLYGSFMANIIAFPVIQKLTKITQEELTGRYVILEAILSIQAGDNPRNLKEKLVSYIPPSGRDALYTEGE